MGRFWDALAALLGEKPSGPVVAQLIPTWQSARPIPTKINYSAYVKEGYKGSPVIFSCIREIVGSASEPVWIMDKGEDSEPIRKHDLLTLLRRPNPEQDGVMFLAAGLTHQHIWGDWYVHKVRSRGRRVVQLWNLRPDRVEIKRDIKGAIEFYRYTVPSNTEEVGGKIGQYYDIPPDDVIHMKWEEDPESDNYGLSPITILARLGDLDTSAIDYLRAFFLNQGIPAGMLKLQNRVQREERDRIKGLFKDEYQGLKSGASVAGGAGGWHGVMVLDATVEYEQIASPTEKLKLQPIFDVTEARICSVFNVPPILVGVMVGLEHSTYANYKEARRSLWEETLSPIYRKLGTAFTNGLVHEFGESEETRLLPDVSKIPALQDDKYQLSGKIVKEWEAELITRNEARAALGYDELDDAEKGDVFFSESKPKPDPMMLDEDGNPIPPKIDPKTGKPLPPKIDPKTGKPIQDPKALGDNGEPQDDDGEPPVPSKVRVFPGKKAAARRALPAAAHARYDARWQAFIDRADPLELAMTRDIAQVIASAAQDTLREVRRSRVAVATLAAVTTPEEVQRGLVKVAEKHLPQVMRAGWEYGVACMRGEHQYSRHALGEVVLDVTFDLLNPFVASYIAERPYEYALEVALSVIEHMRDELVEGVEAGESVDELAHRIENFENVGSMTHARNIARTETISAMNGAALQSYKEARVVPRKRWLTAQDDRVRGTRPSDKYNHVEADGQTVALDQAFVVSGEQLQYPGDGAHASIGNIAQCRCTVVPVFEEQQAYNPNQPRAPKGSSVGGQWVDADGSGSGHDTPEESDIEHRSGEEHHESLNAAAHKWIEEHADAPWDENKLVDYVKFINSRPEVPALVQDLEANADPHPAIQIGSFGPDVPVTYLLGWGKSGATPIHDHADSKVGIIVHKGTVEEEIFVPAGKGVKLLDADGSSTNAARVHRSALTGQVTKWKGAHIHRVFNDSDQYAVTVHSYYPPLSKMGFYEYSEETTEGISSGKLTLTGKWEDDNIRKPPPVKAGRRCPCTWAYNPDQPRAPKGTPTGGQWVDDPNGPGQGEFPLSDERGAPPKTDDAEKKALSQKEIADLLEQHTDSEPLTEDDLLNPGESVHKVYLVKTEDGREWIVKPVTGDEKQPSDTGLGRAIEDDGTHKREVAGAEIAEMVGMGDMVPKVAMGEVTVAMGDDPDDPDDLEPVDATIAEFVPKARTGARAYKPAILEDQERAAYFDFILGNTDRHAGNWMVTEDGHRMKLIDNDMILPDYEMETRDDLWGDVRISYMRENDWKVDSARVEPWVKASPQIQSYLKSNGFSQSVIDGFTSRLDHLVGAADAGVSWSMVLNEFDTSRTGFPNRWGH